MFQGGAGNGGGLTHRHVKDICLVNLGYRVHFVSPPDLDHALDADPFTRSGMHVENLRIGRRLYQGQLETGLRGGHSGPGSLDLHLQGVDLGGG